MNSKIKKSIIVIASTLAATITASAILSFIPTKEKKLKKSGEVKNTQSKNQDNNIPSLPSKKTQNNKIKQRKDFIKLSNRKNSSNLITKEQKINYVALGDSITAGFVATLDKDYSGKYENEKVSGISYPAYLAHTFNQIHRLADFSNFGVTGSEFFEWNLLFKSKGKKESLTPVEIKIIEAKFGSNWAQMYTELAKKLQKANLITVSLGANDFMHTIAKSVGEFPLGEIVKLINSKEADYEAIANTVSKLFNDLFTNIQQRQLFFINELKQLAPNANINFIAFPTPLNTILNMVDRYINNYNDNDGLSISTLLLNLINKKIKFTANSQKIFFINPFDHSYWTKNQKILTPSLFDIHPGSKGYKKMAQDIFIKLISNNRDQEVFEKNGIFWNKEYLQTDQDSYLTQIEVDNPFETIKTVFGDNYHEFVVNNDEQTSDLSAKFNDQNYFNRVLDNIGLEEIIFDRLIVNAFDTDLYNQLDPKNLLKDFLLRNNRENLISLKTWFKDSKLVPNLLKNVEHTFWTKDWDGDNLPGAKVNKITYLLEAFKAELTSEPKIINLILSLTQTKVFKDNLDEFKNISSEILGNISTLDITREKISSVVSLFYNEEVAKFISKNDLERVISLTLNSNVLKQNLAQIIVNIIEDSQEFAKNKTYNDLWFTLINNSKNQQALKNIIDNLFNDLLKNEEFKQILGRSVNRIVIAFPKYFQGVESGKLGELSIDLLNLWNDLNDELQISSKISQNLIAELSKNTPKNFDAASFSRNLINEFNGLFTPENIDKTVIKIVKNISKVNFVKYRQTLQTVVRNLIKNSDVDSASFSDTLGKIYGILGSEIQNVLSEEDFKSVIKKIVTDDDFSNLIDAIIFDLSTLNSNSLNDVNSIFDLIKILFKDIRNTKTLSPAIKLIKKSLNYPEFNQLFINLKQRYLPELQIDVESIKNLTIEFIDNSNLRNLALNFVQNSLLNDLSTVEKIKDPNYLIKTWLATDENKAFVLSNVSDLIKSLVSNANFVEIISAITFSEISQNPDLAKDVNLEEIKSLYTNMFASVDEVIKNKDILNNILNEIIEELSTNGINIDVLKLSQNISSSLFNNTDDNLLSIIKILDKNHFLDRNKGTIKKLLTNSANYLSKSDTINNKIYGLLPEKFSNLITEAEFNQVVKKILSDPKIEQIINISIESLAKIPSEEIQNANSIFDLVRRILINVKDTNLFEISNELLGEIINYPELNKVLDYAKSLLPNSMNKVDINGLKLFIKSIILYPELKELAFSFLTDGIFVENADFDLDLDRMIKTWLSKSQTQTNSARSLDSIVRKIISNENFGTVISSLFHEYLVSNNLDHNLTQEQTQRFITNLLTDIDQLDKKIPFIEKLSQGLVEELSQNGTSFDYRKWLKNAFDTVFTQENKDDIILKITKFIFTSPTFQNNKQYICNLISNVLKSREINSLIAESIYRAIPNTTFNIDNHDKFISIISNILESGELNSVVKVIFENVNNLDSNQVENANSTLDLVKIAINNFASDNTLKKWISLFSLIVKNNELINFLNDNKDNLPEILREVDFNEISQVFNKILQNNAFLNLIKNFRDNTLITLENLEEISDTNQFIKNWMSQQQNSDFKNNLVSLIKDLLGDQHTLNVISTLIYTQLQTDSVLSQNITKDQIKGLISSVFTNLNSFDDQNHLFIKITDILFKELAQNGTEIKPFKILSAITTSLFDEDDKLAAYFNLVKALFRNNAVGSNKTVIKQLLKNIVLYASNNSKLIDLLYAPISKNRFLTTDKEKLQKLITKIANDANLNEFLNIFIENISNLSEDELNDSANIFDLLNKVVTKTKDDALLNNLLLLTKSIIQYDEINYVFDNIKQYLGDDFNNLDNSIIKTFLTDSLGNDDLRSILFDFTKNVILNKDNTLQVFNDANLLVKKWLASEEKITEISTKFNSFIEKILKNDNFRSLLSSFLNSWLKNNNNEVTSDETSAFVEEILNYFSKFNDNSHISNLVIKEFLVHLSQNGTNIDILELLKGLKNVFTNDSNNTLNFVVVKAMKNNKVIAHKKVIKAIIKSSIKTISKESILQNIYQVVSPVIGEYISEDNFVSLVISASENEKLNTFIDALIDDISVFNADNLTDDATLFEISKAVFKNIDNYSSLNPLLDFVAELVQDDKLNDTYQTLISKMPDAFNNVSVVDFKSLLAYTLKNNEIKNIVKSLVKDGLFADGIDKNSIKDKNEVAKKWLLNETKNAQIQQYFRTLIIDITQQESFTNIISRVLYNTMLANEPLAKNIEFEQLKQLIKALFKNINSWDSDTDFINKTLQILINNIKENGLELNYQNIANEIANSILDYENLERSVISLIKSAAKSNIIAENKTTLKNVLNNLIRFIPTKFNVAKSIYDSLPPRVLTTIEGKITPQDFEKVLNDTIINSADEINELFATILDFGENTQALENVESLAQLLNLLLGDQQRRTKIINSIEAIVVNLVGHHDIFELLNTLWKENISKYGVDVNDPANVKFVNDLFHELPSLIKQLKLVPKIIEGIYNSSQNATTTKDMIVKISKEILKSINFADFNLLKIILKSDALINNKEILKQDILKIVKKITSDEALIENFVADFNLLSPLINIGIEESEALATLKETLKSEELRNILNAFLNEIFDNNMQYAELNSWVSALSKFFNSANAQTIKTSLKNWIKNLFTKHEKIGFAIGKLLAKTMQENGINIPQDQVNKIAEFIKEFTREAAKTEIVDNVVDEVFNTLKAIGSHKASEIPHLLQEAFKKGALKFISREDGTIMLGKIFEKKEIFKQIFNGINPKSYVDFINLIFKYSPRSFTDGIYGVMFAPKGKSSNVKFNASSGIGGIIKGELSNFIKIFIQPFVKQYYDDLSKVNAYTSINEMKRNSESFQAMWRFYAFISRILYENTPSGLFWNATSLTTEAYIMNAYVAAINEEAPKHWNNNLRSKYASHPDWIGLNSQGQAINYFVSGLQELRYGFSKYHSRDNGLRDYFYGRDYTLVYIYWADNKDQKYNNDKKKRDTLLDDMIAGYQPIADN
ncbi:SGNH/GDSL hydrolase family protein [Mycoplasma sp. HS2188]|uniref:SGNH/GDSL hydrolase family protein n=1 Tax=Mycoplasma sp. HS2188 TaxID=2976765 RepID=UPI0021AA0253|nr:SGNH/GDSL hydrolase family protein [Mycoplasma sp. HS2188]MCT4469779.1 SGNH/GDSL hydrolase family protein [Mycoplasma sp. HS2188]